MKLKHTVSYFIIGFLMILLSVLIILDPFIYQSELVTHYSVHIMLLIFFGSLTLMKFKKVKLMFLGLFCTLLIALFLKTASNTDLVLPIQNQEPKLKVAHFNLGNIDDDLLEIKKMLVTDSVDIVSFQEYTPQWNQTIINLLRERFPYYKTVVRIDPYGVALFSKTPYIATDIFLLKEKPSLEMIITKNEKSFHIISSYVTPSLDTKSKNDAIQQLNGIAQQVNLSQQPVIALGEYNMVYWSYEIRDFVSKSNLKNSRRSIIEDNLRVPYDHMFYSEKLQCIEFKELQDTLGDHIGIVGTYQHISSDIKDLSHISFTVKG